jgi:hypothetical protein
MKCEDCGCELDGEMFDTENGVLCNKCYNEETSVNEVCSARDDTRNMIGAWPPIPKN